VLNPWLRINSRSKLLSSTFYLWLILCKTWANYSPASTSGHCFYAVSIISFRTKNTASLWYTRRFASLMIGGIYRICLGSCSIKKSSLFYEMFDSIDCYWNLWSFELECKPFFCSKVGVGGISRLYSTYFTSALVVGGSLKFLTLIKPSKLLCYNYSLCSESR